MRIIQFAETFWPLIGGREVLIEQLTHSLQARGHDVRIVTGLHEPDVHAREVRDGISIHRFPFMQVLQTRDIMQVSRLLEELAALYQEFRPDIVHLHDLRPITFFCVRSEKAKPRRLLLTVHGYVEETVDPRQRISLLRLIRSADWVTAVSRSAMERVLELVPEIKDRCCTICNGVHEPPFAPSPLPFDPPRLLCLGRLSQEKGFEVAVSAFAEVMRRGHRAELVFCGDGHMRSSLQQQVEAMNLGGSVRFLGMVPTQSIWQVIDDATLLVLPSRTEGLPLVALEAAVMQRPVVATRVGGVSEAVLDGKTGLLVGPGDVQGMARAMLRLIRAPQEAEAMGLAGQRHMRENFGWEQSVDRYERLYQKLINEIGVSPEPLPG